MVGAVEGGLLDFDLAVATTRALGQTMSRLADWQVGTLLHRIEEIEEDHLDGVHDPGTRPDPQTDLQPDPHQDAQQDRAADGVPATVLADRAEAAARLVGELSSTFEDLMVYTWRRHLAAAVARIEALGANEEDLHTTEVTVGFADIVSFTALSNQISRGEIGDLVEVFESRCAEVVALQQGRVIKSLGDSVLFVNSDAISAYDTAEGIINVIGRDPRMPDVRVGLASGSVVLRMGDVFGPPVNLASRLTAVARRNRIIIDVETGSRLPEDQFETRRLPARPVRGFGLLEPLTVRRH